MFRGKRVDNSEWVYGDLLHPDLYDNGYFIEDFTQNKNNCHEITPSTVGQYTGLTDKNGKKIFEGDIVKADNGHISYVVFHYESFALKCKCHKNSINTLYGDNETVIGNIHDNPELLKGE